MMMKVTRCAAIEPSTSQRARATQHARYRHATISDGKTFDPLKLANTVRPIPFTTVTPRATNHDIHHKAPPQ